MASTTIMTATSTLTDIMGSVIDTTVNLAKTVFVDYWPYILVFGIIAGLVAAFAKFTKLK